ncbi:MAG: type II toxin-antitoxin system VapC family toxin [Legionella sp.]|nr:type II toxin-antitoxin system VapC family toxin [Legionella sp.]
MSYLLDTNVISELVKSVPNEYVLKWINAIDDEKLYISVITIGEIRKGIAGISNSQRQEKISHWLEIELPDYFEDRILAIDIKVADRWGQLQSKNKGYTLPAIDGLLAATAHVYNLKLVTRNKKDFIHAPIDIINPWEEA